MHVEGKLFIALIRMQSYSVVGKDVLTPKDDEGIRGENFLFVPVDVDRCTRA